MPVNLRNHHPFESDAKHHHGYRYTTHEPLSSTVANQRLTDVTEKWLKKIKPLKTVLDIGCGDGTYTNHLRKKFPKVHFSAGDPAKTAITLAQKKYPGITFFYSDLLIPKTLPKKEFSAVVIRGVIHHVSKPARGIKNAVALGRHSLIIEPNGWNPIVKILEMVSPYHRAHGERSFTSWQLKEWATASNSHVTSTYYVGLVPFFSPAWLVGTLKKIEPYVEKSPLAWLLCGQVILEIKH